MSTYRAWCPDGCDEEDAREYNRGDSWSGESWAESIAEFHAERCFDSCDYPKTQRVHVREVESGQLWKFDVETVQRAPAFYATKVKE